MQSLRSMPTRTQPGISLWFINSLVNSNYQTSGILTPDRTAIYTETLLQNYKAELCNKKKNTHLDLI